MSDRRDVDTLLASVREAVNSFAHASLDQRDDPDDESKADACVDLYSAVGDSLDALEVAVRQLENANDPELDATDFAHPAWWRGEEAGLRAAKRIVMGVLDGKITPPFGFGGDYLNEMCERLRQLVEPPEPGEMERAVRAMWDDPGRLYEQAATVAKFHHARDLARRQDAALRQLEGWKREAIEVLAGWDAVFDMVEQKPQDLGKSKSAVVAAALRQRDERIAAQDQALDKIWEIALDADENETGFSAMGALEKICDIASNFAALEDDHADT